MGFICSVGISSYKFENKIRSQILPHVLRPEEFWLRSWSSSVILIFSPSRQSYFVIPPPLCPWEYDDGWGDDDIPPPLCPWEYEHDWENIFLLVNHKYMGSEHDDNIPPPLINWSHDDNLDDDDDSDDYNFITIDQYAMNGDDLFTGSNSFATVATPLYNYDDEG